MKPHRPPAREVADLVVIHRCPVQLDSTGQQVVPQQRLLREKVDAVDLKAIQQPRRGRHDTEHLGPSGTAAAESDVGGEIFAIAV